MASSFYNNTAVQKELEAARASYPAQSANQAQITKQIQQANTSSGGGGSGGSSSSQTTTPTPTPSQTQPMLQALQRRHRHI